MTQGRSSLTRRSAHEPAEEVDVRLEVAVPEEALIHGLAPGVPQGYAPDLAHPTVPPDELQRSFAVPHRIGTMIEVPRPALTADQIASEAEFFSFGTNDDLTQMTWGFSRDDVEAAFFPAYLSQGILAVSPFESLDNEGVGSLITTAVAKGRGGRDPTSPSASAASMVATRTRSTSSRPPGSTSSPANRSAPPWRDSRPRAPCSALASQPAEQDDMRVQCVRDLCPYLVVHPGGTIPPKGTTSVSKVRVVAMTLYADSVLSGHYLEWGVISISVTNAAIIVAMVVVFVLALVVPFPHGRDDSSREPRP